MRYFLRAVKGLQIMVSSTTYKHKDQEISQKPHLLHLWLLQERHIEHPAVSVTLHFLGNRID